MYFVGNLHVSESRELEKLVFCLTGPYLTRRATIGWLELPFVGRARGRFALALLRAALRELKCLK